MLYILQIVLKVMKLKLMLIGGFLLFTGSIFSQITESVKKEILQDFSKFQAKAVLNLISFQDEKTGKYGYIGALSKKIVVPAKYDDLNLFCPTMNGKYKGDYFMLEVKNNRVVFKEEEPIQFSIANLINESEKGHKDLEKGFIISADKFRIEDYSHIYYNVHSPFNYDGKVYAIAEKVMDGKLRKAVISDDGSIMFGLDFPEYKYIVRNKYAADADSVLYFFVVDIHEKLFFINPEGKKIPISEDNGSVIYNEMVVEWLKEIRPVFGYGRYGDRILDFVNMKWLPRKTDGAEIKYIDYTSDIFIDCYTASYIDYPDIKLYIRVKDDKYPYPYYIGWDGYRYIP